MKLQRDVLLVGTLLLLFVSTVTAALAAEADAESCPAGDFPEYVLEEGDEDSTRWSIFDQLSEDETWDVINFLVDDMGFFHERNGTYGREDFPTPHGPSHVYRVELLEPPKAESIAYLEGTGPRPKRYAKGIVIRAAEDPKDVMEYKIGPLPLPKDERTRKELKGKKSPRPGVTVEKLLKDGQIPFVKRPTFKYTSDWSERVVARIAYEMKKPFIDMTGFCYGENNTTPELHEETMAECGTATSMLYWLEFPVIHSNASKRISHIHWFFKPRNAGGDEFELHGVPITFKLDETSHEIDEWDIVDIEYCHQGPFRSIKEFLDAYENDKNLVKCEAPKWKKDDYDERWSKTSGRVSVREGTQKAHPRTYEPEGRRYKVSGRGNGGGGHHFEYLGWEGHVTLRADTGVVFHDVRYRGNRIVYELALQEQYVAYSGYGGAGQVVYFDSYYGMGLSTFPLKRGVDCPESAEYLSSTFMNLGGTVTEQADTICIFEETAQTTDWRHVHRNGTTHGPHTDSVPRTALLVRTIATVGNYDYIYDIRFKLDASIQVQTIMAGYMESGYFGPNGETSKDLPFGTRVHEFTFANLHDHLSSWKVDLDILGTNNSMHRHEVKLGTWEEALKSQEPNAKPPGWHTSPYVKYIDSTIPAKEFGTEHAKDDGAYYIMANDKKTNKWGQPRGYGIVVDKSTYQMLPDNHPLTIAMGWSKHNLAITKRKDSEPKSCTGLYDMNIPQEPYTSFNDIMNDESIVEEDLVAWIAMGVQHIPRSEDIPLITNFGTSFYLKPWNYYDELESMNVGRNNAYKPCVPKGGAGFEYHWDWA